MDDLIKTMKAQLYERVSSPLTTSFVLSWCAWNFRLIVVMLSSMDPAAKFKMIDTVLYPDTWTSWLHLALGPIVTSALYVVFYPFPEGWAFKWAKSKQHELREYQANLDSDVPLTPEQSRELRLQCKKTIDETQTFVDEHKKQVDDLKQRIYELMTNLSQKDQTIEQLGHRAGEILLSDGQAIVLRTLKSNLGTWENVKISLSVSNGGLEVDDTVSDLLSMGCLRQFDTFKEGIAVKGLAITQPGLKALDKFDKESNVMHLGHPKLVGA